LPRVGFATHSRVCYPPLRVYVWLRTTFARLYTPTFWLRLRLVTVAFPHVTRLFAPYVALPTPYTALPPCVASYDSGYADSYRLRFAVRVYARGLRLRLRTFTVGCTPLHTHGLFTVSSALWFGCSRLFYHTCRLVAPVAVRRSRLPLQDTRVYLPPHTPRLYTHTHVWFATPCGTCPVCPVHARFGCPLPTYTVAHTHTAVAVYRAVGLRLLVLWLPWICALRWVRYPYILVCGCLHVTAFGCVYFYYRTRYPCLLPFTQFHTRILLTFALHLRGCTHRFTRCWLRAAFRATRLLVRGLITPRLPWLVCVRGSATVYSHTPVTLHAPHARGFYRLVTVNTRLGSAVYARHGSTPHGCAATRFGSRTVYGLRLVWLPYRLRFGCPGCVFAVGLRVHVLVYGYGSRFTVAVWLFQHYLTDLVVPVTVTAVDTAAPVCRLRTFTGSPRFYLPHITRLPITTLPLHPGCWFVYGCTAYPV